MFGECSVGRTTSSYSVSFVCVDVCLRRGKYWFYPPRVSREILINVKVQVEFYKTGITL
jgi:hypothetical protein